MSTDADIPGVSEEKKRASYADLVALPENVLGQLIDGELFALPRPGSDHTEASTELLLLLGAPFRRGLGGPGGWRLLAEPELHLDEDVLVPDLAGWREERFPRRSGPFYSVVPDWLCEVLSPSTTLLDRNRKLPRYARAGVDYVWLVDPAAQTLEAFRRERDGWRLLATFCGQAKVRAEPFAAFEFPLGLLWPDAGPVAR